MSRVEWNVLYEGIPVQVNLISWLLLGVGGAVLAPIALLSDAGWLLILAVPLLICGLVLRQVHLQVIVESYTGVIRSTLKWLGIQLWTRRHQHAGIETLEIRRVGGDRRERDSDTWYIRLKMQGASYILGRYDTRPEALEARHQLSDIIQSQARPLDAVEVRARAAARMRQEPEGAQSHYQMGLAYLTSGNREGARLAFLQALELAENPLLRRMCEQRLSELDRV
ncbi:MAG: tetratricopeptide repeat protein [Anaerolineae bacterium]|nr:tetratricopeptide repeat protein [Anaerolineae bacterium]